MTNFELIVNKPNLSFEDLVVMLSAKDENLKALYRKASEVKASYVGNKVYLRGLVEYSNICRKNCLYCGIRKGNNNVERYSLTDEQILEAARFAYSNKLGSIVIQGGELDSEAIVNRIENLVIQIKELSNGQLGITLSLGEQSKETYQRWFTAGAHRYLLRIESSNKELYYKIHPKDKLHDFETRLNALHLLKEVGYQVGTGVMIGLPFQTVEDLANDLLFFKKLDIDMCGMGPYIEHQDTPLYEYRNHLRPLEERLALSLKMIASLRILMKDINIASATALQAIDKLGREKGITVGANIIMPNITPGVYRNDYKLYENKPCTDDSAEECISCLEARVGLTGNEIKYAEWGDSLHFKNRE